MHHVGEQSGEQQRQHIRGDEPRLDVDAARLNRGAEGRSERVRELLHVRSGAFETGRMRCYSQRALGDGRVQPLSRGCHDARTWNWAPQGASPIRPNSSRRRPRTGFPRAPRTWLDQTAGLGLWWPVASEDDALRLPVPTYGGPSSFGIRGACCGEVPARHRTAAHTFKIRGDPQLALIPVRRSPPIIEPMQASAGQGKVPVVSEGTASGGDGSRAVRPPTFTPSGA